MADACVDVDELVAMTAGELAAERIEDILVHVDRCAACAEVIANLGALDGGRHIGRYELGQVLGAGAMGIVHDAWDPQLRRRVALKLVRPEHSDAASHARMLREARALARVSHPNVVTVYDVDEHDGEIYVATELVDGETLATWGAGRSPAEIVGAWIQAARGLAAAHAGGVVHRDVKPANVLVGRDGRVRIGDFGLARLGPEDTRAPVHIAGTPAYMSPEQARGGVVDARSDQFALCVAVAEALTGERPAADGVPAVAPRLARVLGRGLRAAPGERFATITALADALSAAIAPPRRARLALIVVGAAVAGASVAWALQPRAATCTIAAVPDALWAAARSEPRVTRWLAGWSTASAEVCTTERDDAALRARRQRCLAGQLDELRTQLATPASKTLEIALQREALPRPSRCAHAALAGTTPPTLAQVVQAAPIRLALHAAHDAATARPLLAAARTLDPALAVEVAQAVARLETGAPRVRTLREAITLARDPHAQIAASLALIAALGPEQLDEAVAVGEVSRGLIAALGGDAALEADLDLALGEAWQRKRGSAQAIALFERAVHGARTAYGPDSLHEANALTALAGARALVAPTGADAIRARDAAIAIYRRAGVEVPGLELIGGAAPARLIAETTAILASTQRSEPGSENEFLAEYAVAAAYAIADQSPPALAHYQRAAALGDHLGIRDAKQVDALGQAAAILVELDRPREAQPLARRAAALAEATSESDLGFALTILGHALIKSGSPAAARAPLIRALAIRDRLHEPAQFRGNTRFLLATALWPAQPRRALELAHAARVDIQSAIDALAGDDPFATRVRQQARLAEIDRWLNVTERTDATPSPRAPSPSSR